MNNFVYSDNDKAAVLHYIMHGSITQAYKFSRMGETEIKKTSLYNTANRYFNSDKIKVLFNLESERFKENINSVCERVGMKNPISENQSPNNTQTDFDSSELDKLDKEQAKKVLVRLINANKTDAKTVSQAMQLLSKLEQWEKEKTTDKSNIVLYELPKKSST